MSNWSGYVKVDFPFPVVTRFEPFCEGCTEGNLDSWTNKIYRDDTDTDTDTMIVQNVVSCHHIDHCRRLFEHFKRATNEIH